MGGPMGMASPRMTQSPRHPNPMDEMMLGQGPQNSQVQGQVQGPGGQGPDPDNGQGSGTTPQDMLSKYVETL